MELANSKRSLSTASWVSVALTEDERRRRDSEPSGAFAKAAIFASLDEAVISVEGLERIARAAEGDDEVLRLVELAGHASERVTYHDLVVDLSSVRTTSLIRFARLAGEQHPSPSVDLMLDVLEHSHRISPVGWLHLERVEMYPIGVERGELVFTVPLAPGETQTISHKEWSTSSETYERIVQDYFESYSERGVAEKTDASMSAENESRHSNALTFGAMLSGGYGPVSLTTTFGLSSTKDERQSAKESTQRTREVTDKASARARQEHKVSVKLESRKGAEDSSFQTITNPGNDAMRIDYYRMMRKWRTDLYRYGLRLTYDITIPAPGARLFARWRRLAELEEQIRQPFVSPLKPTDLTDLNWHEKAAEYGVTIEAPPDPQITLLVNRVLEAGTEGDPVLEFVAPAGYRVSAEAVGSITYWGPAGYPTIYLPEALSSSTTTTSTTFTQESGGSGSGVYKARIRGIGGGERMTLTIVRSSEYRLVIALATAAVRLKDSFSAWQGRAWTAFRDAAQRAHDEHIGRLQAERDRLYSSLMSKDTLSLRLLEREEFLRLVMLWLLGPDSWYSNAPQEIDQLVTAIAGNERNFAAGSAYIDDDSPTFTGITSTEWSRGLLFGEVVRYVHQAIEWENLLYFLYPYYWGSETQGRDKLLFDHPDPAHQKFLRAGYARIVITVRPGFEKDFVTLMETGQLAESAKSQYQSVAQDIQNTARTNYAGIPAANPELHARPLLHPQQRTTWQTMEAVILALEAHRAQYGDHPVTLSDLPVGTPTEDAWGRELLYTYPGSGNDYDLVSLGADGKPGGEGVDADISAGAGSSLIATWFDYTPTSGLDIEVDTPPETIA